ncbi:hypothetical protein DLAC_07777 [Tieghemostelium lacteum]|uniref:FZ domain-containing protein n=1 Tax=Tieghemostelium lacteum TaxID=361077 RepID=A0A151ZAI4_TIELA|nr:hypothetical protein DLAC_07777 [Tieghemostelium lacteum]|eukprot:KYQ90904.1 hypothetical protein DLAC_07777 [Tieghemostelium lacteum]
MIKQLLIASLLIAAVYAQGYPTLPLTFTAQVEITVTSGMMPMPSVSGTMYYDFPNQLQKVVSKDPFFGQTMTTLDRYDMGNEYSYASGQCQCKQITEPMQPMSVLPGSVNVGQENVNGVECDMWQFEMIGGITITNYVNTESATPVLARTNITINSQGQVIVTIFDFSNVNGTIPSGTFAVPSYCANACPVPPPPPSPASFSCPNNPPPQCSCLTSQLNFCTQVNYPVAAGLDAQMVDDLVSTTYNNFMLTNPPAACAASVKSFMCASLFPLCVNGIVPVLPCASMCPSCNCTPGQFGSCPSVNGTSICTQYGNQSCN